MPLFNLVCKSCGHTVTDKLCSYDKAKNTECTECGAIMEIAPTKSGGFKIYGYSFDNGYSKDNISYDGNPNPTW